MLTKYRCEICTEFCPAYISHPLEILEDGTWKFHIKIYDTPAYFNVEADVKFCGANCMLLWHKRNVSYMKLSS